MAEGAEKLERPADIENIIAAVQSGLLFITIIFTAWAAVSASRAAKAANNAVEVSSDTARRQLRAYVHPISANIEMEDSGRIAVSIAFKNAGITPAYKFECKYSLTFSHNLRSPGSPDIEHDMEGKSIATLQPNGVFNGKITARGNPIPEFLKLLADRKLAIFVHGRLTYRDAFKDYQTTNFQYVYIGPWGGKKPLTICEEGNDAT